MSKPASNPSSSKHKIRPVAPKLFDMIEVAYSDIWERPQLSKRERSMITLACMVGMRATDQMRSHMEKALANGVTAEEIGEMLTHLSIYAGIPASISAALVAKPLLLERGLIEEGEQK